MSSVNVCFASDNNYAKYAGVVIASILYNAKEETDLTFYILDGGISEQHKSEIYSLKSIKDCKINFVPINEEDFEDYKRVKTHKYITLATYYRLKLPTLLPNVDRVVYLDCDIVVNDDLTELFNTKLTTEAFAGVHDINKKMVEKSPTYVNAGVLVIDLANMRQQQLEQKFLEWTIEHQKTIQCGDQEIINEVCIGNIKVVDDTWNVQASDFMNRSAYIKEPKIIHFVAKNKPWNWVSLCYYKNFYLKYLQMTPWKKNKWEEFEYKYIEQFLSIIKFIIHRPTFIFLFKFYESIFNTYMKKGVEYFNLYGDIPECKNPKVSIIVPVYNVEDFIARCLNSLSKQTFKEIEILCINDGSTDSSPRILEKFSNRDQRIKIYTQKNEGLSAARNYGLENAKGEYVSFVDSDDWVSLNFIEKMYNAAKKNDADIAVSGVVRTKKHKKTPIIKYLKEKVTDNYIEKLEICDIPTHCYVWNKLYKKQALIDSNITFAKGKIYEDILFTPFILFYTKKLVTVPGARYYYFRHKNTLVKKQSQKAQQDFIYATQKMYDFFKEHNVNVSEWETKTNKYKILGFTIYKTITKGNKKEHILFNCIKWRNEENYVK